MKLNKVTFIFGLIFLATSLGFAMELSPQESKSSSLKAAKEALKTFDLREMAQEIIDDCKDDELILIAKMSLESIGNINLMERFQPFLMEKLPKKNQVNILKLKLLKTDMARMVMGCFTIFDAMEFWGAEKARSGICKDYIPENYTLSQDKVVIYEKDLRPIFLQFQVISKFFCKILEHFGEFDSSVAYGIIKTDFRDLAYFYDANGLVFTSMLVGQLAYQSLPYGEAINGLPRTIIFSKEKVENRPGICAIKTDDPLRPLQLCLFEGAFNGELAFSSSPNNLYFPLPYIINPALIENPQQRALARAILPEINMQQIDQSECQFFALPTEEEDYKILEILLLEDILSETQELTQEELTGLEMKLNELNETLVSTQKTICRNKPKSTPQKSSRGRSKNTVHAVKAHVPLSQEPDVHQLALSKAQNLKVDGRQKWRHVLRLINEIRKEYPSLHIARLCITGSHITLHEDNAQSITIVPKHGKKDLSMPASTVNSFVAKLIAFALQTEKKTL